MLRLQFLHLLSRLSREAPAFVADIISIRKCLESLSPKRPSLGGPSSPVPFLAFWPGLPFQSAFALTAVTKPVKGRAGNQQPGGGGREQYLSLSWSPSRLVVVLLYSLLQEQVRRSRQAAGNFTSVEHGSSDSRGVEEG